MTLQNAIENYISEELKLNTGMQMANDMLLFPHVMEEWSCSCICSLSNNSLKTQLFKITVGGEDSQNNFTQTDDVC